jgi:hypothetical protein
MTLSFFSSLRCSFWIFKRILSDLCLLGASSKSNSQSLILMAVLTSCAVPKAEAYSK